MVQAHKRGAADALGGTVVIKGDDCAVHGFVVENQIEQNDRDGQEIDGLVFPEIPDQALSVALVHGWVPPLRTPRFRRTKAARGAACFGKPRPRQLVLRKNQRAL